MRLLSGSVNPKVLRCTGSSASAHIQYVSGFFGTLGLSLRSFRDGRYKEESSALPLPSIYFCGLGRD